MERKKASHPDLEELRREIDGVDEQILELLSARTKVVARVADYKREAGVQIRDFQRERQLLAARGAQAAELGLSQGPVESMYRQILLASRDYQASLGAAVSPEAEPRNVTIIGGEGAMGRAVARLFTEVGHRVQSADLHTIPSPAQAAANADVMIICVPIDVTEQVIAELGPLLRPGALLMDVTSIKQAPIAAMLASTKADVVGTHPMFGPGVHTFQDQRVVVCRGRGDDAYRWVTATFESRGLAITEATPEEHDRAMALVQVLTHFQTQVFGIALARMGISIAESRKFTSPAYLMELYVAARHFAQAPELYGPIEMLNPETKAVTRAFREAATELSDVLEARDQARFTEIFEEVRGYFGEFSDEATEQSSFLIDRLVERSMGS